jgi:hypothetical protein
VVRPNKLEKLTAVDLIHYRQHLADENGLRPASLNRRLEALRRFCRWAHEQRKLKSNVAAEVKLAHTARRVCPKGLDYAEIQALVPRHNPIVIRSLEKPPPKRSESCARSVPWVSGRDVHLGWSSPCAGKVAVLKVRHVGTQAGIGYAACRS